MFDLLEGAVVVVVVGASKYRNKGGNKGSATTETRVTHDKPQQTIKLGRC